MVKRCYVAGPLGFTESGRHYYEHVYLPALRRVVEVVDPWTLGPAGAPFEPLAAARRNADAIRSCQVVAALLDGQEVDSGTAAEVGYAAALEIPCFGLRTDLREAGEHGVSVNLQVEGFVVQSGGRMCRSLADLTRALAA